LESTVKVDLQLMRGDAIRSFLDVVASFNWVDLRVGWTELRVSEALAGVTAIIRFI
jgi:hypothetical protein